MATRSTDTTAVTATHLNATLVDRQDLSERYRLLRVRPDAPIDQFEPGQYLTLGLPRTPDERPASGGDLAGLVRRPFSIASSNDSLDEIEFLFRVIPDGEFSGKLIHLDTGDTLWLDPKPRGTFTLDHVPNKSDALMIASGDGLAPFMSMLRTYAGRQRWGRVVLVHAVEDDADLAWRHELESLTENDASFTYLPRTGHDSNARDWTTLHQEVEAAFSESTSIRPDPEFNPAEAHVLVCGNPYLIDSTIGVLRHRGLTAEEAGRPGRVHYERYWEAIRD